MNLLEIFFARANVPAVGFPRGHHEAQKMFLRNVFATEVYEFADDVVGPDAQLFALPACPRKSRRFILQVVYFFSGRIAVAMMPMMAAKARPLMPMPPKWSAPPSQP